MESRFAIFLAARRLSLWNMKGNFCTLLSDIEKKDGFRVWYQTETSVRAVLIMQS